MFVPENDAKGTRLTKGTKAADRLMVKTAKHPDVRATTVTHPHSALCYYLENKCNLTARKGFVE